MVEDLKIEAPEPGTPPRSVGFLVSQLGFFSAKGFAEALAPVGIGPKEFLLLRFVAAAAGQPQHALAQKLDVPPSRMVALVDDLEESGLVERRPDPGDRRVRGLHLTSKGTTTLDQAAKVAIDHETKLCSNLDGPEREQLIDLLHKVQKSQTTLRGVHPGINQQPASASE